jgi:hypothetical protein
MSSNSRLTGSRNHIDDAAARATSRRRRARRSPGRRCSSPNESRSAREIVNHNFLEGITYVNVKIDGERVRNIASYMVRVDETKPVVFKVDAGPIQPDGYGGILKAVQGGYWVMLKPLPPGKHRISMFATVPNIDGLTGELAGGYTDLDAKLKLQVR